MDSFNNIARHLIRFSPDALVVVDETGRIRFANDCVRQLLGYEPEDLIGERLDLLVPERFRPRHAEHVSAFMIKPRSREMGVKVPDLCARRRDGSEFPASIRLGFFRTEHGAYAAAAIRDNTERTRVHEALIAAREEADRANRAKSRFLATASHDLRQPLQTIRLLNAAMLKVGRAAEQQELLEQQNQAIEGATRLLNALLDISRLESGAVEVRLSDLSLPVLFEELRAEFVTVAKARNLSLCIEAPQLVLSTDRTLFYQLLQNLLGNALKYTDEGSVTLRCTRGEDGLTLLIEDTGVGIPPDKIERIFDEYYQVDTHGAKRMGVGLGLAIVKEVARLLGYAVLIGSRPGVGTQVRVNIPNRLVKTAPSVPPQPAATPAPARTAAPKARVLLVEDHESVRRATELFLKVEGFDTLSAGSAAAAEALFERLRPDDLLIADYHLDGERTGLDLLMALREGSGRQTPGVILSGDLPGVLRSLKTHPEHCRFLSKPVDTRALLLAIEELSGEPEERRDAAASGDLPARPR